MNIVYLIIAWLICGSIAIKLSYYAEYRYSDDEYMAKMDNGLIGFLFLIGPVALLITILYITWNALASWVNTNHSNSGMKLTRRGEQLQKARDAEKQKKTTNMNSKNARLKAEEARNRVRETLENELDKIFAAIELAANQGKNSVTYTISGTKISGDNLNYIIDKLKSPDFNYKVIHNYGSDPREYESWESLTISW